MANMYDEYQQLYGKMPAEMADPETFYTPELQESVLQQLTQQAEDSRAQNQASISGSAVRSGFGVGNTSREMARRSRADAQALDEIISGSIQQAAAIEDMRRMQSEQQQQNVFAANEDKKNQQQAFDLAKQGYQANIDSTQRAISDQDRYSRQDAVLGGIAGLAGGAADLFAQRQPSVKPTGNVYAANPQLNLPRPNYAFTPFWEAQ